MADACRAGLGGCRGNDDPGVRHGGAGGHGPRCVPLPGAASACLRVDGVRAAGPAARSSDGSAALPDRAGRSRSPQRPFAYARYTLVHSPGSLPFSTAMLWVNTWAYAPATGLAAWSCCWSSPRGGCCRRGGGPRCGRRWPSSRFPWPATPSSRRAWASFPPPAEPVHRAQARRVVRGVSGPGHGVRAGRRRRGGGERDAALAPGGPGKAPAAQVVPRRAAGRGCVHHRDPGRPGPVEPGHRAGLLAP